MAVTGHYIGCNLSDVTPLCAPWENTNGLFFPPLSRAAALLSFELAASAYDMNLDAWREAGWRDFSYQIDNALYTGPSLNKPAGSGLGSVISDYLHHLAHARLNRLNPISQIRGVLRQRESSDTCKAIIMLHPASYGRYIVAIGFMGTGKRIYDWFSNFRLNAEEGVHSGFLQLTREFENRRDEISFPETARELGLERLTLRDILEECRRPDSRFLLWLAGHSQGGAVMQLFALRLIREGMMKQNLLGFGFASPSTVYEHPAFDLGSIPLYHILNADDIFPRMGAAFHAGRCLIMDADEEMRRVCYGNAGKEPLFRAVHSILRRVTDSPSAFTVTMAMLRALEDVSPEDAMAVLNGLIRQIIPEKLLGPLGSRREDILQALIRRTGQGYQMAAGDKEMPEDQLYLLQRRIACLIADHGPKAFSGAVLSALSFPHKLRGVYPGNRLAPYQYIVTERFDDLRQAVWFAPASGMDASVIRGGRRLPQGRFRQFSAARMRKAAR
ncbi:MAG: hypothetical protein Q4G00_06980 [Clostridia bacterium]|nr:hypothetical protein [Clostridia bacterium]